jgi:hypothetical protein
VSAPRRPRLITALCLSLLALGGFSALGALSACQRWTFLEQLPLAVSPAYLLAGDALWAVVFGAAAAGLWRRARWARLGAPLALTLYSAHVWLNRLWLGQSEYGQVTQPCAAVFHMVALAVTWVVLWRPGARPYFSDEGLTHVS